MLKFAFCLFERLMFYFSIRYNINWNYGLLPQTWEDPSLANKEVEGAFGDNDPGMVHWYHPFQRQYCRLLSIKLFCIPAGTKIGNKVSKQANSCWHFFFIVDVVEIGERQGKIGQVLKVKPLTALAMIDEGELDWKIVAISLDDPRASLVNDVEDVEKHFPVSNS